MDKKLCKKMHENLYIKYTQKFKKITVKFESDVEYDMLVLVVGRFVERVKSRLFLFSYGLTIRRSCKFRSSSSGHNMSSE